jgi:NADH dehydrogenase (ubiquinone) 1 alpha subcomplex subunit 5
MATYKTSTGLVGLEVDPNGKETLMKLSEDVLASVKRIPADAQYRITVENWFKHIHSTCGTTDDIKKIEETLDLGQIEEVIENAKDELTLIDYYFDNKGWELVKAQQAEADKMVLEMADSIFFTDPENHPAKIAEKKE